MEDRDDGGNCVVAFLICLFGINILIQEDKISFMVAITALSVHIAAIGYHEDQGFCLLHSFETFNTIGNKKINPFLSPIHEMQEQT